MSIKVHQDLHLIYCISFIEEVKGQNWYWSMLSIYLISTLRIWPYPWTVLFLKWLEINNILFLYKNFKVLHTKAPDRWCFKKRRKDTVDKCQLTRLWSWGLLRGQGKERKVEFRERYWSLWGCIQGHAGKVPEGWENGRPLRANSEHLVPHHKWGSFLKETPFFWKAPILKKQPENPDV